MRGKISINENVLKRGLREQILPFKERDMSSIRLLRADDVI